MRAGMTGRDVFAFTPCFDLLRAGLDSGGFDVDVASLMVRFDDANVIEKEFVAPACSELSLFEEDANLRCSSVVVVGEDLDDHGDFVRCVAFEKDMLHLQLFAS